MREADLQVIKKNPGETYSCFPYQVPLKKYVWQRNFYSSCLHYAWSWISSNEEKEVHPVKYTVFLPFCYIYIYKKNEFDNDIFGPSLSEKDPYCVFSIFF